MLTESLEKIKEESFKQGIERGIERGIEQGELIDKQNILIKLLIKKHGLEEEEIKHIRTIINFEKLDTAIETILFSTNKNQIFDCLK